MPAQCTQGNKYMYSFSSKMKKKKNSNSSIYWKPMKTKKKYLLNIVSIVVGSIVGYQQMNQVHRLWAEWTACVRELENETLRVAKKRTFDWAPFIVDNESLHLMGLRFVLRIHNFCSFSVISTFFSSILIYFNVVCAFLRHHFLLFCLILFLLLPLILVLFLLVLLNQQCKNILHYRKHKVFLHVWFELPHQNIQNKT